MFPVGQKAGLVGAGGEAKAGKEVALRAGGSGEVVGRESEPPACDMAVGSTGR